MSEPLAGRGEQMLGELAEWLHASAHEAKQRLAEAEDAQAFAQLTGSLCKLARGVRQCLLMQRKFEIERRAGEDEATAERAEARADAVQARRARIGRAVGRRLDETWPDEDDLEENEAFSERLERLDTRLDDLAEAEDFLTLDPDTLIARLCEEFGVDPPTSPVAAATAGGGPPAAERAVEGAGPTHSAGHPLHTPNTS